MPEESMAAVVHYALKPGAVELRELPRPRDLSDDEVLLRTGAVGVCGSEVHRYHNTHSWPVNVPVVLGHEFCGVVAGVGKAVRGFQEGDRVTSETAARFLHHLPDSVPFEKAALTEPCSVAYNATCVKTHIRPGDSVLVFGPGPIGLLCLALARASGAGWL